MSGRLDRILPAAPASIAAVCEKSEAAHPGLPPAMDGPTAAKAGRPDPARA